jgi:hypothetical protein
MSPLVAELMVQQMPFIVGELSQDGFRSCSTYMRLCRGG